MGAGEGRDPCWKPGAGLNKRNGYASRIDGNAKDLDAAAARHGVSIVKLDRIGNGCPDRLFGYNGVSTLVEYKYDYDKPRTTRGKPTIERVYAKLNPDQEKWIAEWLGQPVIVVRTEAQLYAALGIRA